MLGGLVLALPAPAAAATLPAGFVDELVTSVSQPIALAFTPDGRLLVTSQAGRLSVWDGSTLAQALDISAKVCSDSERGLLGVAVDPAFASDHFVYLYYTYKNGGTCGTSGPGLPVERVARFTLPASNVIDPTSEQVLVDGIVNTGGNHNAGDLHFGPDGYLYASVGDGGCDYLGDSGCGGANDASRDRNVLLGKVLRITSAGGIPPSNPFQGPGTARCNTGPAAPGVVCQETYAWGLRNPFRFAFDPNAAGTKLFVDDVGQDVWEEVDVGQAGADYGWNVREGHCANGSTTDCGPPPAGMTNPLYDYVHAGGCDVITAGAFVPYGFWPSTFDDSYLFADEGCGQVWRLDPGVGGSSNAPTFGTGLNTPVSFAFGPAGHGQALYYTSYAGQVRRIVYRPAAGSRGPGSLLCGATAPRLVANMPLVFGHSASAYEFVAARNDFFHWNGSSWVLASAAPWLLSFAYSDGPAYQWADVSGTYLGTSAAVRQSFDGTAKGYWAVVQEVRWYAQDGTLVGQDAVLASPARGARAIGGTPLCNEP